MDGVGVVPAGLGAYAGGGEDADGEEFDAVQEGLHLEGMRAHRVLRPCSTQQCHPLQRHPQPPRSRDAHVSVQHHRILGAAAVALRAANPPLLDQPWDSVVRSAQTQKCTWLYTPV